MCRMCSPWRWTSQSGTRRKRSCERARRDCARAKRGSTRQRECRWLDRHVKPFTILLSAEIIKFNDAPHILSLALDITERKRAEGELLKTLEREKELSQLRS